MTAPAPVRPPGWREFTPGFPPGTHRCPYASCPLSIPDVAPVFNHGYRLEVASWRPRFACTRHSRMLLPEVVQWLEDAGRRSLDDPERAEAVRVAYKAWGRKDA